MSTLKCIPMAALAITLGLGLGIVAGWQTAAAITVEDSAGNPDVTAPLTDPDDSAGSDQGNLGLSLGSHDQDGSNNGWQLNLGTSSGSSDGTQTPSQ